MYPNPNTGRFTLKWSTDITGQYSLKIYNLLGQKVETIIDRKITAGIYVHNNINFSHYTSGIYFAKLMDYARARARFITAKIVVIR